MVYLPTLEEWQRNAALLLQARPASARITTKYHIPNLDSKRYASKKRQQPSGEGQNEAAPEAARVPRAVLEVKAYDPVSGVTLKFKTEKSADVGRLVAGLGRMGRTMAALPERAEGLEDAVMEEAPAAEEAAQETKPAPAPAPATGGGGGGKKKKKGKK
ncbi:hypothetical protein WHR41_01331 [Cladosporium halotolerans]|uniref:SRP9 domain-containing protein n=1 Tax=Cladosporium halotolerans TaxID=1052096 RepID=A0AB34KXW8_9PEZI